MINSGVSEHGSFEYSELLVKASSYNLRVIVIYKPPYSDDHRVSISVFLSEFPEYLETVHLWKELLLITSDVNIHVDDLQVSDAWKFLETLEALGLEQHVDQPTHWDGHILDLTIMCMSESLVTSTPVVDQFISDHAAVRYRPAPPRPGLLVNTISYRKIKSVDIDQLKEDIQQTSL